MYTNVLAVSDWHIPIWFVNGYARIHADASCDNTQPRTAVLPGQGCAPTAHRRPGTGNVVTARTQARHRTRYLAYDPAPGIGRTHRRGRAQQYSGQRKLRHATEVGAHAAADVIQRRPRRAGPHRGLGDPRRRPRAGRHRPRRASGGPDGHPRPSAHPSAHRQRRATGARNRAHPRRIRRFRGRRRRERLAVCDATGPRDRHLRRRGQRADRTRRPRSGGVPAGRHRDPAAPDRAHFTRRGRDLRRVDPLLLPRRPSEGDGG